MLVIITRTFIVLFLLVIVLRLMGKREIGELQPFEFVITLVIAELACTPMQDVSVPLSYGIVPIFVVFVLHFFITKLSSKFIGVRKIVNGKPVIVVDEQGIDITNLKKLNMDVNDLLQSMRSAEYFSIPEVKFVIVETNGTMSIMPNDTAEKAQSIPLSLIIEGQFIKENLLISNTNAPDIEKLLKKQNLTVKETVLLCVADGKTFIQPKNKPYIFLEEQ